MKQNIWLNYLYKNVITAFLLFSVITFVNFFLRSFLITIGLFAIAIGIKIDGLVEKKSSINNRKKVITFNREGWLWVYGDDYYGAMGDSASSWRKNCDKEIFFGLLPKLRKVIKTIPVIKAKDKVAMWWYLAIKNPVSNMRSMKLLGCNVTECDFTYYGYYQVSEEYPDEQGWQLVIAVNKNTNIPYFGFYWTFRIKKRLFSLRLGYNIEPNDSIENNNEPERRMVFSLKFFKKL